MVCTLYCAVCAVTLSVYSIYLGQYHALIQFSSPEYASDAKMVRFKFGGGIFSAITSLFPNKFVVKKAGW